MERPTQRNVDDPSVKWEDLALSTLDGASNIYKVASIGEVQARRLLEALAEDREQNKTPETRQFKSVLSLVKVPGWGDKTVLNMIAANWYFQAHNTPPAEELQGAPASDADTAAAAQPVFDQAKENSFSWFIHEARYM